MDKGVLRTHESHVDFVCFKTPLFTSFCSEWLLRDSQNGSIYWRQTSLPPVCRPLHQKHMVKQTHKIWGLQAGGELHLGEKGELGDHLAPPSLALSN